MRHLSEKEQKKLKRILLSAALLVVVKLLPVEGWIAALCYLPPYLIVGWEVLAGAISNIRRGQVFDEDFLMTIATVGAFATAEYAEAVFVMLFFQTGELFEEYAVGKSRQSIAALMDIRPDTAVVEGEDGSLTEVSPEDVAVGAVIVVKPGQRVPLDGVVLSGISSLDTAALTGEAAPREVGPGDACLSGCVNQSGLLRIQVTRPCHESTVSKILELVEDASENKSVSENFITRFARYYTPCVVAAAALLAVVPPLFVGGWSDWIHRALIFLVISCPCALVISVPMSFFGGIGAASKSGILVKGSNYLEALAQADTVVFDKTGTLTQGKFTVVGVCPTEGFSKEQLLHYAALAERHSNHPIALALQREEVSGSVTNEEELAGYGVRATVDGKRICVGSRRLMGSEAECPEVSGGVVHVSIEGVYAGYILLSDLPKPDAKEAIAALKRRGVRRTVMLTGDTEETARAVAQELGLDEYHAQLLPADKVAWVERLQKDSIKLVFAGDGINDAPVLTRCDIGVAMGALGSDAAIEAADVVLMDDQLSKLSLAIGISRKTLRIVRQNIVFALGVKFGVMLLGAFGRANMWLAVFADVGVAFLAILNAMRCLKGGEDT